MTLAETAAPLEAAKPPYPINLMVERPERQRRLTNAPLLGTVIRYFLVIPHLVLLYAVILLAYVGYIMATFVVLFRGRYPLGMYKLVAGYIRWQQGVSGYMYHLFDEYPPMDLDQRPGARVTVEIPYPEKPSRLLNSPFLGVAIKSLLLIPHVIVLYVLASLALVVTFLATIVILFTLRYPAGMHAFVVGVLRWTCRLFAYLFGLTDRYPPFSAVD
jgi:hypothetical protein